MDYTAIYILVGYLAGPPLRRVSSKLLRYSWLSWSATVVFVPHLYKIYIPPILPPRSQYRKPTANLGLEDTLRPRSILLRRWTSDNTIIVGIKLGFVSRIIQNGHHSDSYQKVRLCHRVGANKKIEKRERHEESDFVAHRAHFDHQHDFLHFAKPPQQEQW